MVRIAYMIQAHKNPQALNKLIAALNYESVDFYVHIDSKSDIDKDIVVRSNVFVLQDRIDVKWGHISQVLATLNLMKAVKASGKEYDYVWLISGQDFPIKSNQFIHTKLQENTQVNYIEIIKKEDNRYLRYLKRNTTWYPTWGASPVFIMRVLRKLYNYATGGATKSWFKRKNYLGVEWAFGSSWFTITYQAMCYILEQVESKPYLQYFKNCICPDESFFQTILFNSPYKETCQNNLVYVDWSEGKKNPKILTDEDYEALKKSDKLIARKFEGDISMTVAELSKEILNAK